MCKVRVSPAFWPLPGEFSIAAVSTFELKIVVLSARAVNFSIKTFVLSACLPIWDLQIVVRPAFPLRLEFANLRFTGADARL